MLSRRGKVRAAGCGILCPNAQPCPPRPFNLKSLLGLPMTAVAFRVLASSLLLLAASVADAQARLYERLSGRIGVAASADTLIDRVTADPRLARSFKDSNL